MAITLEFGVCNLLSEFFAQAFCIFCFPQSARAISTIFFHFVFKTFNEFFVGIQRYFHINSSKT